MDSTVSDTAGQMCRLIRSYTDHVWQKDDFDGRSSNDQWERPENLKKKKWKIARLKTADWKLWRATPSSSAIFPSTIRLYYSSRNNYWLTGNDTLRKSNKFLSGSSSRYSFCFINFASIVSEKNQISTVSNANSFSIVTILYIWVL